MTQNLPLLPQKYPILDYFIPLIYCIITTVLHIFNFRKFCYENQAFIPNDGVALSALTLSACQSHTQITAHKPPPINALKFGFAVHQKQQTSECRHWQGVFVKHFGLPFCQTKYVLLYLLRCESPTQVQSSKIAHRPKMTVFCLQCDDL